MEKDKKNIDPAEIQAEIEKLLKNKLGDGVKIFSRVEEARPKNNLRFNFNYTPKEIKAYLDEFVIKQDDAKKALAIAVCDHYNHVKEDYLKNGDIDYNYSKQNVLILGPTGVGKTFLVKTIAKFIGVPFVKADATKFTETGYVGANVDDLVRDLVQIADGDVNLAQYGIVYFDEVDKIASSNKHGGKDISGRGVQNTLLKLMEETDIDLNASHDMNAQMQAFMDFQRTGKIAKKIINTRNILFIVSGAFTGLDDIIKQRLKTRRVGLGVLPESKEENWNQFVTTKDLTDFGMEPEFVGRLPVRPVCAPLSENDLYCIIKDSRGSIIKQYQHSFKGYGIKLLVEDDALKEIAKLSIKEMTGARGLMTVCERIFRDFKFELPSIGVTELCLTSELVLNPKAVLDKIIIDRYQRLKLPFVENIRKLEKQIMDEENINIVINDELVDYFFAKQINNIYTFLKGLVHGFRVVQKNIGSERFEIGLDTWRNPTRYLESLIKDSYK